MSNWLVTLHSSSVSPIIEAHIVNRLKQFKNIESYYFDILHTPHYDTVYFNYK